MLLFTILYKFVPAFDSVDETHQKASEFHWLCSVAASYYTVKEILTFYSVLKCGPSNESY